VLEYQQGDLRRALGDPIVDANRQPILVQTTEGATVPARKNMVFDPTTGNPDGSGRRHCATDWQTACRYLFIGHL